jgi:hypothetical protein
MRESPAVAEALRKFFRSNASGDPSTYPDVVSASDAVLVIGSTAREWFSGQAAVQGAYGLEGAQIDTGQVAAWENGDTGWAVATPVFAFTGGPSIKLRFSAVLVREDGAWKLAHVHGSHPVPDEVAVEHPQWWDSPDEGD